MNGSISSTPILSIRRTKKKLRDRNKEKINESSLKDLKLQSEGGAKIVT